MRSSAFVQTAFCQEGFQGEDEPEQAFKVQSREAIHTISCRVDDRSRGSRERSSMMSTT